MSKEVAEKFLSICESDPKVEEAIRILPEEKRDSFESIADIAAGFGYEFTAEELAQAFAERSAASREAIVGQALSVEELEQVAGGLKMDECSDNFNPQEWCWFVDKCSATWNYYKRNPRCISTFEWFKQCTFDDNCNDSVNQYEIVNTEEDFW